MPASVSRGFTYGLWFEGEKPVKPVGTLRSPRLARGLGVSASHRCSYVEKGRQRSRPRGCTVPSFFALKYPCRRTHRVRSQMWSLLLDARDVPTLHKVARRGSIAAWATVVDVLKEKALSNWYVRTC